MATALPYIAMAVGTGLSMKANSDAASERRNIINSQLEGTQRATEKAAALVDKESQQYDPNARKQALTDQEQQAFERSQKDLQFGAGGGSLIDTAGGGGNVSGDFLKAKADRQVTEGNNLTALAREVAKTRAPSLLLTKEGQSRANLAGNLQNTFGAARNMANAAGQDASMVQPAAYGQIAQAVGNMGAMYMSGGTGGTKAGGTKAGGGTRVSGTPSINNFA